MACSQDKGADTARGVVQRLDEQFDPRDLIARTKVVPQLLHLIRCPVPHTGLSSNPLHATNTSLNWHPPSIPWRSETSRAVIQMMHLPGFEGIYFHLAVGCKSCKCPLSNLMCGEAIYGDPMEKRLGHGHYAKTLHLHPARLERFAHVVSPSAKYPSIGFIHRVFHLPPHSVRVTT